MKTPTLLHLLAAAMLAAAVSSVMLRSPLAAQEFSFQREINPFPVLDENGTPYDFAMTGGLNRPVHQFVDIDGNQTPDLFLQDRAGQLIFFRNIGTPAAYQFQWETDQFQNLMVGDWFKLADADLDGDFDLFTEKPFGLIRYYRNDGSASNPLFVNATDALRDDAGDSIFVDFLSIPDWADIDCDTDLDLFLGRQSGGRISFYRNVGITPDNLPRYEFVTDTFQGLSILTGGGAGKGLPLAENPNEAHGANAMSFIDIDSDQDLDLFWGDFFAGSLIYLQNDGSCTIPEIDITLEHYPPNNPISTGGHNVPRFVDIDADGDQDMFVGVLGGAISFITNAAENFFFFENTGSITQPFFTERTRNFIKSIDIGQKTIPAFVDIDGDGDLDIFLANQEDVLSPDHSNSRIYFYENTGSFNNPAFRLVSRHYLNYDKRFDLNYAPAFVDIDADGDADLFLGKWDGKITFYRNDGGPTSPNFVRVDEFYGGIDVGNNNTPTFADLDGDGDFDMICGEFAGNLNFYRNIGTPSAANFQLENNQYLGLDVGDFSYPWLEDIDNDGDADLLMGSDDQGTVLYRNNGSPQVPNFSLDPAFQVPEHLRTSPHLIDIDGDSDLDFFSGTDGGGLIFYRRQQAVGTGEEKPPLSQLPTTIALLRNYPNPFNPETRIEYELRLNGAELGKSHTLTIYNLLGKELRRWAFLNDQLTIRRTVVWDGRDAAGRQLPSGVYFYRLSAGTGMAAVGKMLLAR